MRGERQLLRLGEYLVGRACQRLPDGTRQERRREWAAELPAILHDPEVRFAPWRAARMLAYAADTLRGTARTPGRAQGREDLVRVTPGPAGRTVPMFELLFLGIGLAGAALSSWLIVQAPGDGQNYLELTWSLLFAAYFTSRLVRALARMTTPLMFSAAVALEALSIWQAVQDPGNWVNYFWAALLGLVLLAALPVALALLSRRPAPAPEGRDHD